MGRPPTLQAVGPSGRDAGRWVGWRHRRGMTLVELLVVIAIVGVLAALLLPAVQMAREAARRAECKNRLKQIGTAFALHHDAYRHYPTDGWGWQWAGDAARGFDWHQPGGWCFNVLPFLEQADLRAEAVGGASTAEVLRTPVAVFYCPSRRAPKAYPYTEAHFPLRNSDPVGWAAKTDYAVCAGDRIIHTPAGPPSTDPADLRAYRWPPFHQASGISYVLTRIRAADVLDGTSTTLMVGEKYLLRRHYRDGQSLGDDQTAYLGDDADIRRWTDEPPRADGEDDDIQHFGSAHADGCHFVLCDGSVRLVTYSVDATVFQHLGNRHDGELVDLGR